MGKTKEMIADFRRLAHAHVAIQIHGEPVEIVNSYKCFSRIFEDILKWDLNTEGITTKGHQDSIHCGSSDLLMSIQLFLSTEIECFDFYLLVL